jgi:hypothetical protein
MVQPTSGGLILTESQCCGCGSNTIYTRRRNKVGSKRRGKEVLKMDVDKKSGICQLLSAHRMALDMTLTWENRRFGNIPLIGCVGPQTGQIRAYSPSTVILWPITKGHVKEVGIAVAGLEMRLFGSANSHSTHGAPVR